MSQIAEAYGYDDLDETMTRKQIILAMKNHSIPLSEFDTEHPLSDEYNTDEVLTWLGY